MQNNGDSPYIIFGVQKILRRTLNAKMYSDIVEELCVKWVYSGVTLSNFFANLNI
jgi:hypothetical protein